MFLVKKINRLRTLVEETDKDSRHCRLCKERLGRDVLRAGYVPVKKTLAMLSLGTHTQLV